MATTNLGDLIKWSQQPFGITATLKSPTWAYESYREQLTLHESMELDDLAQLYYNCDSSISALHITQSQVLYQHNTSQLRIALRWGILRIPVPFMRDRDAVYLECSQSFVDCYGRQGFARLLMSYPFGTVDHDFVRVQVHRWGVVLQTTDVPSTVLASSVVDVDWKGNMASSMAIYMTTTIARSTKNLPSLVWRTKREAREQCSMCLNKAARCEWPHQVVPCVECHKPLCFSCCAIGIRSAGSPICFRCVCYNAKYPTTSSPALQKAKPIVQPLDLAYLSLLKLK